MDLAELVYEVSAEMPADERFGLISQMRRSSVSVPSNIAEGHGRNTNKNFLNFLGMAQGSLKELELNYYCAAALDLLSLKNSIIWLNDQRSWAV